MSDNAADWPRPEYDTDNEPLFIFIVTPPYSGSTALCKLLNTSHRSMLLDPRGEGQWLVPGLSNSQRWQAELAVDYESVRAVWLNKFQSVQALTQTIDVVIEKSPPNMVRMEQLSSQFKSCSFLANNRDPYANCASILYRHHDADNLDTDRRISIVQKLAADWQFRSEYIRKLVEKKSIPLVTYETFCDDPASVISALDIAENLKASINPVAEVQVKDYGQQPVFNQNERQISSISRQEIAAISSVLVKDRHLMDFFGYELRL
jgi:hypothetical protein